ncbi:hypothetical protein [Lichenihabitans psoromatis]|uniref:hypothetical protein n=1 Tax=Lichenihabitans psoromatis TaxID=2528642 RepID=UPI0013F16B1E|nr:hypothetical protein [Lichenihabitans psoromatis]
MRAPDERITSAKPATITALLAPSSRRARAGTSRLEGGLLIACGFAFVPKRIDDHS